VDNLKKGLPFKERITMSSNYWCGQPSPSSSCHKCPMRATCDKAGDEPSSVTNLEDASVSADIVFSRRISNLEKTIDVYASLCEEMSKEIEEYRNLGAHLAERFSREIEEYRKIATKAILEKKVQ